MADTPPPELQPASENPWYRLATARKDHVANRDLWNGYMRHLIGDAVANLQRADATRLVLLSIRFDEIEQIREEIPGLPQELPEEISLSGLDFAEAVNFQDFYFPVSVDFRGSRFAGDADFEKSTFGGNATFTEISFGGNADFEKSSFAAVANFTDSSFKRHADFEKSIFGGDADFEKSTFGGNADFAKSTFWGAATFTESTFWGAATFTESTFWGAAIFEGRTFEGGANFAKSTFKGLATFTGRTFAGPADFSNAKYEGKTSFQNVTFTVAPLFFETTLHEDTNWTEITWPKKPEDKEDATEYVRRYDRLALMMSTLKQPDNEHRFFRLSMRAKEVRDGWGINIISTFSSRLYGLFFRYGWGFERALGLWVAHLVLGAVYLRGMALWQMSQPLSCLKNCPALAISFSNSLPFLGLQRGPAKSAYACFDTLTGFNITYACFDTLTGFDMLWTIQSLSGPLLLFFLLLTIRNRFRLR